MNLPRDLKLVLNKLNEEKRVRDLMTLQEQIAHLRAHIVRLQKENAELINDNEAGCMSVTTMTRKLAKLEEEHTANSLGARTGVYRA